MIHLMLFQQLMVKKTIDILESEEKKKNIKAVLLDLNMPNVNGFEVLDYYKSKRFI